MACRPATIPSTKDTNMSTRIDEIADGIYRLSTFVPDIGPTGFTFNQYLIDDEQPLLFHTGPRATFASVAEAIASVTPLRRLRWITFGHLEADECGAMNELLAAAPDAQVAHGALGCMVSLNDLADRPPAPLADGQVLELGRHRVRHIDTPHVPHAWEARVLYEETTGTLLCGDLFTQLGDGPAMTDNDIVEPASAAEDVFGATCLTPGTGPTIRRLAGLNPTTLAVMHGSCFSGDGNGALLALADDYDRRLTVATASAN
jgi:flavorubredoxin